LSVLLRYQRGSKSFCKSAAGPSVARLCFPGLSLALAPGFRGTAGSINLNFC
jgi:hypothetical protein